MNETDVMASISEKTGIAADVCKKIVKAFEEQAEEAFIGRFKGHKNGHADMIAGISKKSSVAPEDCERVIAALDEALDRGLSDKLRFLK